VGLTTAPRLKNIVTKSEEVKAGPISLGRCRKGLKKVALNGDEWANFLRRPGPTRGCRANDDDADDDDDDSL